VAVVTGASRGVGRGIAHALGMTGATVYVTGRTVGAGRAAPAGTLPGTIEETAAAVTAAGGQGIAVPCDHADDDQVAALFARVAEEAGQLDILVNNATAIPAALTGPGAFWEKPLDMTDMLTVGLRSQYVASWHAAPLLLRGRAAGRPPGLIAFTSAPGAVCYMYGPAYGAQKAGVDKLAADMAVDLREHRVAAVSIWLGLVLTERTRLALQREPARYASRLPNLETPEFTGRVIAALYADPAVMALSGQTLIGAEAAERYGIVDEEGRRPVSRRATLGSPHVGHPAIVR
jgi:NAD(P)-dependent dehydrogenase (short-subunit alcohol dehydrogenase family)